MICDDNVTDWIPDELKYAFSIDDIVIRGGWTLNLQEIAENVRWTDKPDNEILLKRLDDRMLRWNRDTRQYKLYSYNEADETHEENLTLIDESFSIYSLGSKERQTTIYHYQPTYQPLVNYIRHNYHNTDNIDY